MMKQLIFVALFLIANGVFIWTMQRYVRVMTLGGADLRPRFDQIPKRIWNVILYFFLQKKVAERQRPPASSSYHHVIIFWGFLIITVGTIELTLNGFVPAFNYGLI